MNLDVKGYSPVVDTVLQAGSSSLHGYRQRLEGVVTAGDYNQPEASLNLPSDEHLVEQVEKFISSFVTPQLRYVFLIGIGGSNLGALAVYNALFTARDMTPHTQPRLVTVDTNNPSLLGGVKELICTITDKAEFVIVSISKSGGTTETIANTEIVLEALESRCGPVPERVVVISDMNSAFLTAAKNRGMHTFAIPPQVGGRYSVFSAVGLLPLALCGVNIRQLQSGAQQAVQIGLHSDVSHNPAAQLALLQVDALANQKTIHDFFTFNSELETVGKWWRQLVGESLGKTTLATKKVTGITPTVSIGSTDLHSVGQLYLAGPADKLTLFVYAESAATLNVPTSRVLPELVPMITGKSLSVIMEAILKGTMTAFTKRKRPFVSIILPSINPYELGYLMQVCMMSTIYTGKLLGVNPFDQPDVEAYKTFTKQLLEKSK